MDILIQIYRLFDESLSVIFRRSKAGDQLWDTLAPEQQWLFEDYQIDQGRLEDSAANPLFHRAASGLLPYFRG